MNILLLAFERVIDLFVPFQNRLDVDAQNLHYLNLFLHVLVIIAFKDKAESDRANALCMQLCGSD